MTYIDIITPTPPPIVDVYPPSPSTIDVTTPTTLLVDVTIPPPPSTIDVTTITGLPGAQGDPGPAGPAGPPGSSTTTYPYQYQSNATPPPASGFIRSNASTAATTTVIWVNKLDANGVDRTPSLTIGNTNDSLYVQDQSNATCYAMFTLTANATDSGTYITYAVTLASQGSTPLVGNKPSVIFGVIVRSTTPAPSSYRYVQMTAATTWVIPHNLGFYPNVSVTDSTGREIVPDVTYTNASTVTLTFTPAAAGEAYLS